MAYPTGLLSLTLEDIDRRLVRLKSAVQAARTAAVTANVAGPRITDLWSLLKGERAALVTAAGTPGLAQFARDQKNNQTLDVVTEFNNVIAAIDNVTAWIQANFPNTGGFLLAQSFGASSLTDREFTPAQLTGYVTQLDSLIALIA